MSSDFIEQKKLKMHQEQESRRAQYFALVRKAALSKLSPAEDASFDALSQALGQNIETLEAQFSAVRKEAQLLPIVGTRQQCVDALAAMDRESNVFREKEAKTLQDLAIESQGIRGRYQEATGQIEQVDKAGAALEELQRENWQVLGAPDPSLRKNGRHLLAVAFSGRPQDTKYDVAEFEAVMSHPEAFKDTFDIRGTVEWIPAPGQTPEELATLLAVARSIVDKGRSVKYLVPLTYPEAVCNLDAVVVVDISNKLIPAMAAVDSILWVTAPNQTQQELDAMIKTIAKKQGITLEPAPAVAKPV